MWKVIIVDDEDHCVGRLSNLLKKIDSNITILNSYSNVADAVEGINSLNPDLVFLDVVLTDGTGFDILRQVDDIDFEIIFTTAHNTYAIKAFEFSAIHYLLKPIGQDDLSVALDRYKKKTISKDHNKKLDVLIHNLDVSAAKDKKIGVPTSDGIIFIKIGEVVRLEADGNYVRIFLSGGEKHLVIRPLKYYSDLLDKRYFFRTHQSHLVNLAFVDKYIKGKKAHLVLSNGETILVSIRKREFFLKQLSNNRQI
jgi:two-component system LytT family response regulator